MYRGYKYRAYPTRNQQTLLRQTFGCCRYVWNQALEYRSSEKAPLPAGWLKNLRQQRESEWLQSVPAVPLHQVLRDLDKAYVAFFKRNSRYPKFKSKRRSRSSARFEKSAYDFRSGQLWMIKLGVVPVVWHRPLPDGEVRSCTVSEDASGRWWVSFKVELSDPKKLPKLDTTVGIDLGLTHLATLSTGEKIVNPRREKRDREKLAKAQRSLARKEKGSKNREKARKQVARVHAKITDRRRDHLHKLTSRLVRENQTIVLEDLNIQVMMGQHSLARAISDASWNTLIYMLTYKAEACGRTLVKIDRWYPSSKTCSACGHLLAHLPLNVREWSCLSCGLLHDRDVNAALNIKTAGLAGLVCGETVRPDGRKSARQGSMKQKVSA